ncbi:MAG: hypothetical protein MR902_04805 [Campylobacter sp.]|nr:hypothetical protein [Campylobacter sp.]
MKAAVYLSSGEFFECEAYGKGGEVCGEMVAVDNLFDYSSVLCDEKYKNKVLLFLPSQIGITGVNNEIKGKNMQAACAVARVFDKFTSNDKATKSLEEFLVKQGKFMLGGVDTRALHQILIKNPETKVAISTINFDKATLRENLQNSL